MPPPDDVKPARANKKAAQKTDAEPPKKRGRRAKDDYLIEADKELQKLKLEYSQKKVGMVVAERAKARNRISALESRIKKRQNQDSLNSELNTLREKCNQLTNILNSSIEGST